MSSSSIVIYSLLAGLAPLISSSIPYLLFKNGINPKHYHILLALSAGLLFSVATLELLPEAIEMSASTVSTDGTLIDSSSAAIASHILKNITSTTTTNNLEHRGTTRSLNTNNDINNNDGGGHGHGDGDLENVRVPMYGLALGFTVLILIELVLAGTPGGHSHSLPPQHQSLENDKVKGYNQIQNIDDDDDVEKNKSNIIELMNYKEHSNRNNIQNNSSNNKGNNDHHHQDDIITEHNHDHHSHHDDSHEDDHNDNSILSGTPTSDNNSPILKSKPHSISNNNNSSSNGNNNNSNKITTSTTLKLSLTTIIALSIHSMVDGMVISGAFKASGDIGSRVALAIVIHKLPDGFVMSSIILSQKRILGYHPFFYFLFIACMTPIGSFISSILFGGISPLSVSFILGFGAGTFLNITTSGILPELLHHPQISKLYVLACLFIGYVSFILIDGAVDLH